MFRIFALRFDRGHFVAMRKNRFITHPRTDGNE